MGEVIGEPVAKPAHGSVIFMLGIKNNNTRGGVKFNNN
jgi:hypothetical protein